MRKYERDFKINWRSSFASTRINFFITSYICVVI